MVAVTISAETQLAALSAAARKAINCSQMNGPAKVTVPLFYSLYNEDVLSSILLLGWVHLVKSIVLQA